MNSLAVRLPLLYVLSLDSASRVSRPFEVVGTLLLAGDWREPVGGEGSARICRKFSLERRSAMLLHRT